MEVGIVAGIIFFVFIVIIIAGVVGSTDKNSNTIQDEDTFKNYKANEYIVVGNDIKEHKKNVIVQENGIIEEQNIHSQNYMKEVEKETYDSPDFRMEVLDAEDQNYSDGSSGCSVYFKITNKTQKRLHIRFDNFTIIKSNSEERDFSCWLNDFNIYSTYVYSGNSKKGCVIFKDTKAYAIFKLIIELSDISNNKKYTLFFEQKYGKWIFSNSNMQTLDEEMSNTEDSKNLAKLLKNKIERIEGFEERLGISLENISVDVDKDLSSIKITGEAIRTQQEPNIKAFDIIANFYNEDNAIIKREEENIYNFEGYDSFEITMYEPEEVKNVTKIRLFVKGEIENG